MTDLAILREMIIDEAKVPLEVSSNLTFARLTEPQCPDYEVTITGLPGDALVIKVDRFSPDTVLNGEKNECCKRADYVIVTERNGRTHVLYIELKKGQKSEREVIAQLTGAKCFIQYCQAIGVSFWQNNAFLGQPKEWFVSLAHIPSRKRSTRNKPVDNRGTHSRPRKLLKISGRAMVYFRELVPA